MRIHVIQVGKTQAPYVPIEAEFQKRLSAFAKIRVTTLAVSTKEKESREIEEKIGKDTHLVILDERGREWTSVEFAKFIEKEKNFLAGQITFVIGGPEGITENLRDKTDTLMSLSKMTIAHQLARLFFWEQLYRAFTIISGHPYHK